MGVFDFKKDRTDLYRPGISPVIVDVPQMLFLMTDGQGDPNTSEDFSRAMETLYGLSYAIRMNKTEVNYFAYVVPPVEGFWDYGNAEDYAANHATPSKDMFRWTLVIRQPDFVTPEVFERAQATLAKKKPKLNPAPVRLTRFTEGLCVQAMHIGSYDAEPATIHTMERYQQQRGFTLDHSGTRRHHEIYLSNPKTANPETMKTILRLPIKKR